MLTGERETEDGEQVRRGEGGEPGPSGDCSSVGQQMGAQAEA